MTGQAVGNIVDLLGLAWRIGAGSRAGGELVPLHTSEHPLMDSIFDSNFGGAAIRYGEVPGDMGVLESPDNPLPIGIACGSSGRAEGLALFRLQVHKADLPRCGCAKTDGSCWSKSERGRGAGDALAKKGRARYCLTQWGRAPRGVGREAVDPRAGRNRSGMIPPHGSAPRP